MATVLLWEPHNVWFNVFKSVVDLVAETQTHSLLLRERIKYLHRDSMLICLHSTLKNIFFNSDNIVRDSIYYLFASVYRPIVPPQTAYLRIFSAKSPLRVVWAGCIGDWILLEQKCAQLARHFEHVGRALGVYPYSKGKKKELNCHTGVMCSQSDLKKSLSRVNTEICLHRMFKLMDNVKVAVSEIVAQRQSGECCLIIDNICGDTVQNVPERYAALLLLQFFEQLQIRDSVALCKLHFRKHTRQGDLCKILSEANTTRYCRCTDTGMKDGCCKHIKFLKQFSKGMATVYGMEVLVSCEIFLNIIT